MNRQHPSPDTSQAQGELVRLKMILVRLNMIPIRLKEILVRLKVKSWISYSMRNKCLFFFFAFYPLSGVHYSSTNLLKQIPSELFNLRILIKNMDIMRKN